MVLCTTTRNVEPIVHEYVSLYVSLSSFTANHFCNLTTQLDIRKVPESNTTLPPSTLLYYSTSTLTRIFLLHILSQKGKSSYKGGGLGGTHRVRKDFLNNGQKGKVG